MLWYGIASLCPNFAEKYGLEDEMLSLLDIDPSLIYNRVEFAVGKKIVYRYSKTDVPVCINHTNKPKSRPFSKHEL